MAALAVYTTVYPGALPFLGPWYQSLQDQSDRDYDLWIGVDLIEPQEVEAALGGQVTATWVKAKPGDSHARIRQRAFEQIVERHEAVVLVDSDDLLHPSRVAAARSSLEEYDLSGCTLQLIDETGRELGLTVGLTKGEEADQVLPRHNVFGLSNVAFRSDLLRRCLPIPDEVVLVDWFLATRAWLLGARFGFDPEVRMYYRQHGANTARMRPPFLEEQVIGDTRLVRDQFRILIANLTEGALSTRTRSLKQVAADVELFYERVAVRPVRLEQYVKALNALGTMSYWWATVAQPELSEMWNSEEPT